MKNKEIELKYSADDIKLEAFVNFSNGFTIKKKMMVSSYDDYFINSDDNFIRYRHHEGRGELTIKRKVIEKNNNERIEINVPTSGDNLKTIEAFVDLLGYKFNFGIFKTAQIYWIDKVVLVYYVVYDKELKELRRFIEVEADEDLVWASEEEAWAEVVKWEKLLEPLNISAQNRLKKSLYEIFRKAS